MISPFLPVKYLDRFTMPLALAVFLTGSLTEESNSLKLRWSFNQVMSQPGTTSVMPMKRRKTWSQLSRHSKKFYFLILAIRWRDPEEMPWGTRYKCTKEFPSSLRIDDPNNVTRFSVLFFINSVIFNQSWTFLPLMNFCTFSRNYMSRLEHPLILYLDDWIYTFQKMVYLLNVSSSSLSVFFLICLFHNFIMSL